MSKFKALVDIYNQFPFTIDRGEGVFLYDTSGKRYIDFYGGHAVTIIGHSAPEIADALNQQARRLLFYSNLVDTPIRDEGASRLLEFGGFKAHRVFFCNSGAEANENALKIAIQLTGRKKIVSYHGSFHGRTMLALAATDHPDWHERFSGWIGPVERITPNEPAGLSSVTGEVAAVILEPIQSIGGVTVFTDEYLLSLRKRCDEVGALLIYDEVQTGVGRTGVPFVSTSCPAKPDLTTLAKGLGGGFPMGAVIMTAPIAADLSKGDIAATFGGGPLAIAAMMAVLETIQNKNLCANAKAVETYVRQEFASLPISEIRGKGCLLGLIVKKPAKEVQAALFERGMITGPNSNPNLVHLLPPLTLESTHLDMLRASLAEIL